MRAARLLLLVAGGIALAPPLAAAERRPTAISMGVSATVEQPPFAAQVRGLPVAVDAGTVVKGELWWHASASFGAADAPDGSAGHTFDLRTGPRLQRCWDRQLCVGASLELGWGHSRWNMSTRTGAWSYDDLQLEARVRAAVALSPTGRVLLEVSGGPRARYYLRGADDTGARAELDAALARGVAAGLALIVRN